MVKKDGIIALATALMMASPVATADQLDDIIASGKLLFAVRLDSPPMGKCGTRRTSSRLCRSDRGRRTAMTKSTAIGRARY